MKKLFNYMFASLLLLTVLFTGCKKDKDPVVVEGLPTKMTISITQPSTFTARDNNASVNETKFKIVDVFIYNANTDVLERYQRLDGQTDFTQEQVGEGVYVSNSTIAATTGPKNVYIGVNLPVTLANAIRAYGPSTLKSIITVDDIIDGVENDGFAMFNYEKTPITFTTVESENKVNVKVKRFVAKVTVQEINGLELNVVGGTLSELMVNTSNVNTRFFPLPFFDGGTYKDPNWASQPAGVIKASDLYESALADYININPSTVSSTKDLKAKYILENTSENRFADEMTYAVLRAKFSPIDIMLPGFTTGMNPEYPNAETFYRLKMTNGDLFYLLDDQVAIDYAASKGDDTYELDTFANGYCYYHMYLNPTKSYNVFRNDFYKVTISRINGLGKPTPIDDGHIPLEVPTNISITVEVVDWNLVDYETQLP